MYTYTVHACMPRIVCVLLHIHTLDICTIVRMKINSTSWQGHWLTHSYICGKYATSTQNKKNLEKTNTSRFRKKNRIGYHKKICSSMFCCTIHTCTRRYIDTYQNKYRVGNTYKPNHKHTRTHTLKISTDRINIARVCKINSHSGNYWRPLLRS